MIVRSVWLKTVNQTSTRQILSIVRSALTATFGSTPTAPMPPVGGGASGALIQRFEVTGTAYLLRIETRRDALRNPHQHLCMQAAADAGVAPPVHYVDQD